MPAKASSSWPLPSVSLPLQRVTDGILQPTHGALSSSLPPPSAIMQGLLPPMPHQQGHAPFHPATTDRYPGGPSSQYSSPMVVGHGQGAMLPGVQSLAGIARYPYDARGTQAPGLIHEEPVAYFGSHPICGSDKCSHMLAGATFVQAEIVDYNGKKEAMFVFSVSAITVPVRESYLDASQCDTTGPRRQSRGHVRAALPHNEPHVPNWHRPSIPHPRRVLRRAFQGILHQRVSRAASLDRAHKGQSCQPARPRLRSRARRAPSGYRVNIPPKPRVAPLHVRHPREHARNRAQAPHEV